MNRLWFHRWLQLVGFHRLVHFLLISRWRLQQQKHHLIQWKRQQASSRQASCHRQASCRQQASSHPSFLPFYQRVFCRRQASCRPSSRQVSYRQRVSSRPSSLLSFLPSSRRASCHRQASCHQQASSRQLSSRRASLRQACLPGHLAD